MLLAHFVYRAHSEIQYSNYLNKKSRNETKMVSGSEQTLKALQMTPIFLFYIQCTLIRPYLNKAQFT